MDPIIPLPTARLVHGRHAPILQLCRGRRVLHVGCTDGTLLRERFDIGRHMHQLLASEAAELWGVDIDEAGIEFLREKGFSNVHAADATALDRVAPLKGKRFDIIVASELIEHLPNPGLFLESVKSVMIPGHTRLAVTVPNAFRIRTLLQLLRGIEYVHPDHNYWFSYVTATNLLKKSGYEIERVDVYHLGRYHVLPGFLRRMRRRSNGAAVEAAAPQDRGIPEETRGSGEAVQGRVNRYMRTLPERVLASILYRRSPFWGDGLILIATLPELV